MKPVYIHSAASISAQPTFDTYAQLPEFTVVVGKMTEAIHPNYKDYISPSALRRMATGVKMGVAAANKALKDAHLMAPDAIITGTGMGCIEDTEKFLNTIISNDEAFLAPTSFIQSTHNTVGAQIALGVQCKAYNNTYVHGALSFESALMDAHMLIQQEDANNVLVGGIDELGDEFVKAVRMLEDQNPKGIKVPFGEGASFFVLSSEYKTNAIELLDIISFSELVADNIPDILNAFLTQNSVNLKTIDLLVFGNNGDSFDFYYEQVASIFPLETLPLTYKQLCGEFYTASAFGLFLSYTLLKTQNTPEILLQNKASLTTIKTILLYNQFKGRDHSFILLKTC